MPGVALVLYCTKERAGRTQLLQLFAGTVPAHDIWPTTMLPDTANRRAGEIDELLLISFNDKEIAGDNAAFCFYLFQKVAQFSQCRDQR